MFGLCRVIQDSMTTDETCRQLGLTLTPEQWRACRYLERQGQRFCIDFGYDNAVEKARAHWRARRKQRGGAATSYSLPH